MSISRQGQGHVVAVTQRRHWTVVFMKSSRLTKRREDAPVVQVPAYEIAIMFFCWVQCISQQPQPLEPDPCLLLNHQSLEVSPCRRWQDPSLLAGGRRIQGGHVEDSWLAPLPSEHCWTMADNSLLFECRVYQAPSGLALYWEQNRDVNRRQPSTAEYHTASAFPSLAPTLDPAAIPNKRWHM